MTGRRHGDPPDTTHPEQAEPEGREYFPFRACVAVSYRRRMLIDTAGSRPQGNPGAAEDLARQIRREVALLHTVDVADVGSWRGYGASQATSRLGNARTDLSTAADHLRTLAATLDRAADELRQDQQAWDRRQTETRTDRRPETHHAAGS
jgi:hypothetical protein